MNFGKGQAEALPPPQINQMLRRGFLDGEHLLWIGQLSSRDQHFPCAVTSVCKHRRGKRVGGRGNVGLQEA